MVGFPRAHLAGLLAALCVLHGAIPATGGQSGRPTADGLFAVVADGCSAQRNSSGLVTVTVTVPSESVAAAVPSLGFLVVYVQGVEQVRTADVSGRVGDHKPADYQGNGL